MVSKILMERRTPTKYDIEFACLAFFFHVKWLMFEIKDYSHIFLMFIKIGNIDWKVYSTKNNKTGRYLSIFLLWIKSKNFISNIYWHIFHILITFRFRNNILNKKSVWYFDLLFCAWCQYCFKCGHNLCQGCILSQVIQVSFIFFMYVQCTLN